MTDDKVVPIKPFKSAEDAYAEGTDHQFKTPEIKLGPWSSYSLLNDPKHLCFTLSRYKFCAKMLEGRKTCLEVGPGDGIGLPLIAQSVGNVYAVDWDGRLIAGNKRRLEEITNIEHMCYDLNKEDIPLANIDAAISIDVIEHIDPDNEDNFMRSILKTLHPDAILITGTPNISAAKYASARSNAQHINLHSHQSLREMTARYCTHVFMFGQNDDVIHTGFGPMAHYIWSLGVGIKAKYLL
jgi:2-polyprenyl-3-methyl-5-hydroxy-6-metoxy-1,4-benzoquinol methylase